MATDKYAEIKAGETTVDVACTSIETGVDLNGIHEGAIQTLVDPIPYIESVTNITETDGGADPESDESLKDRIYIAPSRYSTAGTEEAYIYWVKTYNSTIADVKVSSDNPGEVDIVFLMDNGIPSQEMITGLTKYITDPNIRPLTDKVVVKAPTAVNYSISLTYYINSSDSAYSLVKLLNLFELLIKHSESKWTCKPHFSSVTTSFPFIPRVFFHLFTYL